MGGTSHWSKEKSLGKYALGLEILGWIGTSARCWVLGDRKRSQGPFRVLTHHGQVRIEKGSLRIRNRPYFENYIVDASIFRPGFIQVDDLPRIYA
jgi:hypothetical protein